MTERIRAKLGNEVTSRIMAHMQDQMWAMFKRFSQRTGLTEEEIIRLARDLLKEKQNGGPT